MRPSYHVSGRLPPLLRDRVLAASAKGHFRIRRLAPARFRVVDAKRQEFMVRVGGEKMRCSCGLTDLCDHIIAVLSHANINVRHGHFETKTLSRWESRLVFGEAQPTDEEKVAAQTLSATVEGSLDLGVSRKGRGPQAAAANCNPGLVSSRHAPARTQETAAGSGPGSARHATASPESPGSSESGDGDASEDHSLSVAESKVQSLEAFRRLRAQNDAGTDAVIRGLSEVLEHTKSDRQRGERTLRLLGHGSAGAGAATLDSFIGMMPSAISVLESDDASATGTEESSAAT